MTARPSAETGAGLAALSEHLGYSVGAPSGDGWVGLDEIVGSCLLDRMAGELVASTGRRDVAGSYLGSRLSGAVVGRTAAAVALHRRCPDPSPAGVALHLHPDGWFDQVAFRGGQVVVVGDDPAAGAAGTIAVADQSELRTWWAERTVAAIGPLLDAVRRRHAYGRRGLWGAAADRVASSVLTLARATGQASEQAWAETDALLDALARHAPVPLNRPTPFTVAVPAYRQAPFMTKGTCCLYYRTVEEPDPCGEGYCSTCPLADADHRARRLTTWLDELAATAAPAAVSHR